MAKVNSSNEAKEAKEITCLLSWYRLHHFPLSPHRGVPLTSPPESIWWGTCPDPEKFRSVSQGWDSLSCCSLKQSLILPFLVPTWPVLQRLSVKMLHTKGLHEEMYFALSFGQFKSICCGERDVCSKGVWLHYIIYDTSLFWVAIALFFSIEKVQQHEVQSQFTQTT